MVLLSWWRPVATSAAKPRCSPPARLPVPRPAGTRPATAEQDQPPRPPGPGRPPTIPPIRPPSRPRPRLPTPPPATRPHLTAPVQASSWIPIWVEASRCVIFGLKTARTGRSVRPIPTMGEVAGTLHVVYRWFPTRSRREIAAPTWASGAKTIATRPCCAGMWIPPRTPGYASISAKGRRLRPPAPTPARSAPLPTMGS